MKISYSKFFITATLIACLARPQSLKAQEEGDSAKATIQLSLVDQDTLKEVDARVTGVGNDSVTPLKDVEIHFYVKRIYGLLPIGDPQTTDENGNASVDFPLNLPGDSVGDVTVVARIEDDDALGTVEVRKTVKWGIPVIYKSLNQRALWASGANAPIPLVITVTSLIVVVWGVILYIIAQLFKIRKMGVK